MITEIESIYLDNNSTTPLDDRVINVMNKAFKEFWANPSSASSLGVKAKEGINLARKQVAKCINCLEENVIFTSGGTEGNNMAIHSSVKYGQGFSAKPHIVTSLVEHDATLKLVKYLEEENQIELTLIPMKKDGTVSCEEFLNAVKDNTCLISLMMANNETGVIYPVSDLGQCLRILNDKRIENNLGKILFHTDAAQTIGKVSVDMTALNIDYLTIVGHKFYGPRFGAICRKDSNTPLNPILIGGGQEFGLRPGTENTPMIVGLGEACDIVTNSLEKFQNHMKMVCDHLQAELQRIFCEDVIFNFPNVKKLPNTLSVSFVGICARELLNNCPRIIASTGSACHSSTISLSRVLLLALDEKVARGTVRLSVGRSTTFDEISLAVNLLRSAYLNLISDTNL